VVKKKRRKPKMSDDCKHEELVPVVNDYGIFDQKTGLYKLKDGVYKLDEWSEWETKDGTREEVLTEINCEDCGMVFMDDTCITIEEDDPMYEKVMALVKSIRSELKYE
jgi:hypothetical protein